jgi:hypothetical protein
MERAKRDSSTTKRLSKREDGPAYDTQVSTVVYAMGNLGAADTSSEIAALFRHRSAAVKFSVVQALRKLDSQPKVELHLFRLFIETPRSDFSTRIALVEALSNHKCSEDTVVMILDESYTSASASPNGTSACEEACMAACKVR